MEKFEKVCKGLSCHVYGHPHTRCHYCPYWGTGPHGSSECNVLAADALALIRQQRERIKELEAARAARVMTLEEVCGWTKGEPLFIEEDGPSGNFSGYNVFHFSDYQYVCFTPFRGDGAYFLKEDYRLTWRCWTQRPTDEQREAAKWE